jgi:succinate-semialdehyde dehydrogenase
MSKIAFALKTKNAIISAPHPKSKKGSNLAVELILEALKPYGVPENLIQ